MLIAFIQWCVCGTGLVLLRVLTPVPLLPLWQNTLHQWEMCTPRKKDLVGPSYVEHHTGQGSPRTGESPSMNRMDSTIRPLKELGEFRGKGYQSSSVWGLNYTCTTVLGCVHVLDFLPDPAKLARMHVLFIMHAFLYFRPKCIFIYSLSYYMHFRFKILLYMTLSTVDTCTYNTMFPGIAMCICIFLMRRYVLMSICLYIYII